MTILVRRLRFVIVVFPDHTHLLFSIGKDMTGQPDFSGKLNNHFSQVSAGNGITISVKFQQDMT